MVKYAQGYKRLESRLPDDHHRSPVTIEGVFYGKSWYS